MDFPELFHGSASIYEPGDVIRPGVWGSPFTYLGSEHNLSMREYALESIRVLGTEVDVSRLSSVFAFEDLALARTFTRENRHLGAFIYEVRPTSAAHVRADMQWLATAVNPQNNAQFMQWMCPRGTTADEFRRRALAYWSGQSVAAFTGNPVTTQWEWLLADPVEVVRVLGRP